jgi:endonuclease/exonuclease/phosphatase family metal-dependent hydrolase
MDPGALIVVSANLKHDYPRFRDMETRLEAFAQLVETEGADILLLQEVARTKSFDVDEWLKNRLNMGYVYARANGHKEGIGFEEGVAIFSRFPISDPEVRELSSGRNPFTRRIALNASILLPGGTIEAFTVHLGIAPGGNQQQIHALQDWASSYPAQTPVIVGGDFNAENHTSRIQEIQSVWTDTYLAAGPDEEPITHVLETPWGLALREHRLDYIFLAAGESGWETSATRHMETKDIEHSDHKVVITELQQTH